MTSLGESYPKEQARLRALIQTYADLGPVGKFGKLMIEDVLRRADEAAISGDVAKMVECYKAMEGCE